MKRKFIQSVILALIFNSLFLINNCMSQWVSINMGTATNMTIYSFVTIGNNIFAGTNDGVFLSTNNGSNWAQIGMNNQTVYTLKTLGNTIFAGSYGFFMSADNGITWTQPSVLNRAVYSIATLSNKVFAGTTYNGVYLSSNNGTSWTQTGLSGRTVNSLVIFKDTIFAGTQDSGVYLSVDSGASWTKNVLNNKTVYSFAINGNNIFAGTLTYGVYLSTNTGTSWTQTSLNNITARSFIVSEGNVFTGTGNNGVYLSTNNGTNWVMKNQGFATLPSIYSLVILNNYILGGSYGEFVYRRLYSEIISIRTISTELPSGFSLSQNYPNPFNPVTNLEFGISDLGFTSLKVYDLLGKKVATLVNEKLNPGTYRVEFDAGNLTSGVYFYRLTAGDFTDTKRMMIVK